MVMGCFLNPNNDELLSGLPCRALCKKRPSLRE